MVKRLRTTSFAGFGAILLALIVSGMVAAASLLTAIAAPEPDQVGPAVVDTTQTFEDADAATGSTTTARRTSWRTTPPRPLTPRST
jgi:hypothetical protein